MAKLTSIPPRHEIAKMMLFAIPVGLALPALLIASGLSGRPTQPWLWWKIAAAFSPAAFFSFVNFFLSFLRYHWWKLRGSCGSFKSVSVVPVVGTIATCLAVGLTWGDLRAIILGAILCLLDTGGGTWFLINMILMPFRTTTRPRN